MVFRAAARIVSRAVRVGGSRLSRATRRNARFAAVPAARTFSSGGGSSSSLPTTIAVAAVVAGGIWYVFKDGRGIPKAPKKGKAAPHIIISGAPGSGKGTQCENIVKQYGVVHISTGDILREHVKGGTDLGKQAKEFMSKGALVPDELVISMVKAKLAEPEVQAKGWLLDGFPRTPAQAKALGDAGVKADVFLQLDVPDEVLVERICGRRTDPVSGKIYHLKFNPPPADNEVQKRLVHRSDDTEEALRTRLVAYHNNVNGIMDFYKSIVVNVNGHGNAGFKENVARVQSELTSGIEASRHRG